MRDEVNAYEDRIGGGGGSSHKRGELQLDPVKYLVCVVPKPEKVSIGVEESQFQEENTELSMLSSPLGAHLYISPDGTPRPTPGGIAYNSKRGVNSGKEEDDDDVSVQTSSDAVLENMGFGNMMAKYSNFNNREVAQLSSRLGVQAEEHDDVRTMLTSASSATAATSTTRNALQEALHGNASTGSPMDLKTDLKSGAKSSQSSSRTTSSVSSRPANAMTGTSSVTSAALSKGVSPESDRALGIAERLARGINHASATTGTTVSSAASVNSGSYRAALGLGSGDDHGSYTDMRSARSEPPPPGSVSGSISSISGALKGALSGVGSNGVKKYDTKTDTSSRAGTTTSSTIRSRSGSSVGGNSVGSVKSRSSAVSASSKKIPSYMQATSSSASTTDKATKKTSSATTKKK